VTVRGAVPDAEMVSVKFRDLVCEGLDESVTVKVSGAALTAVVGVPVIAPEDALSASPAGSVPDETDHV
jgi:hypothetical protein